MTSRYGLTLVTAPALEPVTLDEAKKQVEVAFVDSQHNDHLNRLIRAAREYVEERTGRAILTQTWDLFADSIPYDMLSMSLPKPPLASVTHLKYYDTSGVQQTWSSSNYIVSTNREPGRLALAYGISWPSVQARPDAVSVRFVAGNTTQALVPFRLKAAMLLLIAHWFEYRSEAISGTIINEVPTAAEALIKQATVGDEFTQYGACVAY